MKKLLSVIFVLALVVSLASCAMLPESFVDTLNGLKDQIFGAEHVHEFVYSESESVPAACLVEGLEVKICSCGERQETVLEAKEHNMELSKETEPNCVRAGSIEYTCSECGKKTKESVLPLGHNYEEAPSEPSRLIRCTNEGCVSAYFGESNGKHTEALTFSFTAEDEQAFEDKFNQVLALVNAAAEYDPALHAYVEEGALVDEYLIVDAMQTELYDLLLNAVSQRQLAMVAYYCDMKNTELEETYSYMMDYCTAAIAKFYTLSRPFYDSCYREFYYYGMTEEEILAFLFDSDALSNPEYAALKERNDAIELEFFGDSSKLPELYEEFVANNNAMAQLMGYENYLEYAYSNVYGRDYTYQDVAELSAYVKKHFSPLFNEVYYQYKTMSGFTQKDVNEANTQTSASFFENLTGNTTLNDYIDLLAFSSNPDKQITFSDEFNKLMGDGNMFRGQYQGAFVTTITSVNIPIAYFSRNYDNPFTVVHEFGHYMNEVYNSEGYNQSYDLLEMHSQGNELLYLAYLEDCLTTKNGYRLVELDQMFNFFYIITAGMVVDSFEQAVYLNEYVSDSDVDDRIMADGKITANEYDLLFTSICDDYGITSNVLDTYWTHGMTITSPCYYVSYSISAISVLQLYEMANVDGFDAAKDAYLKLFTYVDSVDENNVMSTEEILLNAGLYSYNDEQLYIALADFFGKMYK